MEIDRRTAITFSEASRDFPAVARLVERYGAAVVFQDNAPRYLVLDFDSAGQPRTAPESEVLAASRALIEKNRAAYAELAK